MRALNINVLLMVVMLLSGCATAPPAKNPLAEWSPSANFDERKPRLIVLHATEMASAGRALAVLKSRNSSGRVSAHYLIADDGRIIQLVEDSLLFQEVDRDEAQGNVVERIRAEFGAPPNLVELGPIDDF